MNIRNSVNQKYKEYVKTKASLNKQVEKELDRQIDAYSSLSQEKMFGQNYRQRIDDERRAPTILAEGDSWFRYVIGHAIIWNLELLLDLEILNLAWPGDEAKEMLTGRQRARLIHALRKAPAVRQKFDFLLFSGGGNDLVGRDVFHLWLHHYETGMVAEECINEDALNVAFNLLKLKYEDLIEIRNKYSKTTKIIFNTYDYAIPDGRKACGLGPWLQPGLKLRRIPERLRRDVVKVFLSRYRGLMLELSQQHERVLIADTQNTLQDQHWENELHPTKIGFKKIAQVYEKLINENM